MIVEAVEALLRDHCTPAAVRAMEASGDAQPLLRVFEQAGFLDLLRSEEEGGAGLPLAEFHPVLVQFGRHAAPVALAEAIVGRGAGALPAHFAAAMHAALMAGAMARCFEMTLAWCNQRVQFGRTLGKFQAIQHQLAEMAQLVAAVGIAAEAAFQGDARVPELLPAAIAKARASEAAVPVANTAHALHGAIGITEEYDLQLYTRRLHAWRIAHGSEAYWNRRVGDALLASGQALAEFITTPRRPA
jgi:alkylation response protein AidB-like acyl-CoA dehydrogenase